MAARYGLDHYQSAAAVGSARVATTIHSLWKFEGWLDAHGDGVLVLDELRSILPVFHSATLRVPCRCARALDWCHAAP